MDRLPQLSEGASGRRALYENFPIIGQAAVAFTVPHILCLTEILILAPERQQQLVSGLFLSQTKEYGPEQSNSLQSLAKGEMQDRG